MSKNNEKGKQSPEEEVTGAEQRPERETPADTSPQPEETGKPGTGKGKDSSAAEVEELKQELSKEKDLLLRTVAEYENFRKRTEREKRAIYADATADAVASILPIADSLEYAVKAQDGATEEYQKGLELVNKQFQESLQKLGVTAIGEAGEEFDPALHNAVAHIDDDAIADNTVVEVFQKGYLLGEKVIRHAMVKVAN